MSLPDQPAAPEQQQFFFVRKPDEVYDHEALEGVMRAHRQMLELALRDFRDKPVIEDEWLEWLLESDLTRPFSFTYCCTELGYDAKTIRIRTANYLYRYSKLTEEQKRKIEIEVF